MGIDVPVVDMVEGQRIPGSFEGVQVVVPSRRELPRVPAEADIDYKPGSIQEVDLTSLLNLSFQ